MDFQEFKKQFTEQLFDEYEVTMSLNDCAGGIPMSPALVASWIDATCKDKSQQERDKIVEATVEDLPEVSEEIEAKSWVTFKKNSEGHIYIEGRCVKAMLKECGNILKGMVPNGGKQSGKYAKSDTGITNLKSKIADRVFVVNDKVFFTKNGERVTECQNEERPIHVMTPQGPRSSLKKIDFLTDVQATFKVRRLCNNDVPEQTLYAILVYAQSIGLGSDRSQGRGVMSDIDCVKTKTAVKSRKKGE